EEPELLASAAAWRCGDILLKPAAHNAEAAWVAQALDTLSPEDVRVSRPLRSTDGRWVVSGWSASRDIAGQPEPRHDDVVAMSLRLHSASRQLEAPRFRQDRQDIYALADRMSWGEEDYRLPEDKGGRLYDVLVGARREVRLPAQV